MAVRSEFCPNCFHVIGEAEVCPDCGYDAFERSNLLALPMNMVLHNRYVAGKILGAGGFGITYKAMDLETGEMCAIKEFVPLGCSNRSQDGYTLTASSRDNEELFEHGKERFLEEASILSSLQYISAVVKIKDCFLENGTAYFVMEFLEGLSLNQLRKVAGGKLSFDNAYEVVYAIGECLEEVHTKANIFHRDISPENIFIKGDGSVRLIDFGTAKYIHGRKSQNLSVVLKPGFAPPEQYSSSASQGAYTDVYALAGTLYFILTGKKVPSAPDRLGGSDFEPVDQLMGQKYKGLTEILEKALKLKASDRTQSAGEFVRQLSQFNESIKEKESSRTPIDSIPQSETPTPGQSRELTGITGNTTPLNEVSTDHDMISKRKPSRISDMPPTIAPIVVKQKKNPFVDGLSGSIMGYRYFIPMNTMVTVGRGLRNSICIKDQSGFISHRHMELFFDSDSGMFFVEEFSTNGTSINGIRCEKNIIYPVKSGSYISLAADTCVIQLGMENE